MPAPDARLAPCPSSPNCVSSRAGPSDEVHYIEPLRFQGDAVAARGRLASILRAMPGAELVADEEHYLHFTFTTRVLRFVDDVEFVFDPTDSIIHCRSASRVGYGDLGVNRRRIEKVRRLWDSQVP